MPLFQIVIPVSLDSGNFLSVALGGRIVGIALAAIAAYFLAFIIVLIVRSAVRRKHRLARGFKKTVLLVTVPRESADEGSARKEMGLQEIQEKIGAAESLFAAIGGLPAEKGFKAWFLGREDDLSFEIVAKDGLIHFYVAVPAKLRTVLEEQLHANYPHAQIEEIEDYNIFTPTGVVSGVYLAGKREAYFPIKSYRKLEVDPLSNITNALASVPSPDGAAIQILMRSAKKEWRAPAVKIASLMQQGKSLDDAQRASGGGPGKMLSHLAPNQKPSNEPKKERRLSPLEEQMVKGLEEKASKAGLDVVIRIVACGSKKEAADQYVSDIVNAWNQFNSYQYGNSFVKVVPVKKTSFIRDFIYRSWNEQKQTVLNAEEAASVFHFPGPWIATPNIKWLGGRSAPPPVNMPKEGITFGTNVYRGIETTVRIKRADRRRHLYLIGRSGVGKSEFIKHCAIQDIQNGEGVCVVDPHGDLVEGILEHIPAERAEDVIVFDPSDTDRPMGMNMLEVEREDQKDFVVQEMISIFYELFPPEMIGPMFEHNMRNFMLTLMSDPQNPGTIAEIPRMISDKQFQEAWVKKVTDPVVRAFWEKEVAKTSDFHKSEMMGYLVSKIGRFVENNMMRNIIGQTKSSFNLRAVMDEKKILLVNLSKGKTGEVNARLLGLVIVAKLQMAALSRANQDERDRHDFYLYIDEFQNFITDSITTILSEARKYKLNLVIAHQYMGQLSPKGDTKIRDAVLGNAGSIMAFRIGVEDAEILQKEFAPTFSSYDLINVEKYTAYLKLLIDNTAAKPFNMQTFPPQPGNPRLASAIKELSRLKYGKSRVVVEEDILERSQLGEKAKVPSADAAK